MQASIAQDLYLKRRTEPSFSILRKYYQDLIVEADSTKRQGFLTVALANPVSELEAEVLNSLRSEGYEIFVTESGGIATVEIKWADKVTAAQNTQNASFFVTQPLPSNTEDINFRYIQSNVATLYWYFVFTGIAHGYTATPAYTGSQLDSITYQERTGHASADVPSRNSGNRRFARELYTYTSGNLTKIQRQYSINSGTTWVNFTDLEGNAFGTLSYTGTQWTGSDWSNT